MGLKFRPTPAPAVCPFHGFLSEIEPRREDGAERCLCAQGNVGQGQTRWDSRRWSPDRLRAAIQRLERHPIRVRCTSEAKVPLSTPQPARLRSHGGDALGPKATPQAAAGSSLEVEP